MSDLMRKHEMTEEDIKLQFITPAIEGAGWDRQRQIRMEYNFTDGRVIVRGNVTARGRRKRTDYLLYYKPKEWTLCDYSSRRLLVWHRQCEDCNKAEASV